MTPQAPTPVGTPSGVVVTALLGLGAAMLLLARSGAQQDGAALRQLSGFVDGLGTLTNKTRADASRAEAIADAKLRILGEAERRRAAVEERAKAQAQLIARGRQVPVLGARKVNGTGLE